MRSARRGCIVRWIASVRGERGIRRGVKQLKVRRLQVLKGLDVVLLAWGVTRPVFGIVRNSIRSVDLTRHSQLSLDL